MREFYWRGRKWTIRFVDEIDPEEDTQGKLLSERGEIWVKRGVPDDLIYQIIFHEASHVMFPEWKKEPSATSGAELGILERDMPALLRALGVDLSPMLEGR